MNHKLPEGWKHSKVKDILNVKYGKDQKQVVDPEGDFPILGTGGLMGYANKFLFDKPSVLIGRKGTIDKPQYLEIPFWTVDTLFYTDIKQNASPKWVYYLFTSVNWKKYNEASGVPSLSVQNIENISILLPPIEEQRKIAEILGTVDEKISNIDQQISATETLKKGLMQKLFTEGIGHTEFKSTEIGTLPKSWEVRSIENIADVSSSKRIMKSEYVNEGIPFYRSKEIILKSRRHKLADVIYISNERFISLKEKFGAPVTGDILITAVGTIGVCYVVQEEEFYFKDGNLLWMRNISDNLNSDFLIYYFQTRNFKKSIEDVSGGSNQHALTIIKFNNVCLPLPPIEEQQKIASILTEVDNKIESLKKKKEKQTTLKTGLMQQLLTGQKRVKI